MTDESMDEMTSDEWFQTNWTQDEYLEQYRNEALDEIRRERSFFNYWLQRIENEKDRPLSDAEMTEFLSYHKWWGSFGHLVGCLAYQNRLSLEDCHMTLALVSAKSYAGRILREIILRNEQAMKWQTKLSESLELKEYGITSELINSISESDKEEAIQIIDSSKMPEDRKAAFLLRLK